MILNARKIRERILDLAYNTGANGSHLGGSLSLVEVLIAVYTTAKITPLDKQRDRVILSKGHGALALFVVLEKLGLLPKEEVDTFEHNGTQFFAHAKRDIDRGLEFSGGSLSLGVSFAVGVAIACKKQGLKNHVYVIVGDGECDEGLVWEATMAAAHYKLDNLTIIVDRNSLQSDGDTSKVMNSSRLVEKFASFGCLTYEVDGHSISNITKILNSSVYGQPKVIIAKTIKGKGVSFMENDRNWHHSTLSQQQYEQALKEIRYGKV